MSAALPAEVPVLIVGAGPVGLGLAADLGWRGVECLLVEQGDTTVAHPRANVVHARTMEFCRRWGIADQVRAASLPAEFARTVSYVTSLTGWELSRLEPPARGTGAAADISPERAQHCNQIRFDPIMRAAAASFDHVALRFRSRLAGFAQDADGVTAEIEDVRSGARRNVRARYLADCSGGASAIRDRLGIGLEGTPVLGRSVNVFFHSVELSRVHDKGRVAMFMIAGPNGVWANIVAIDGDAFWRLTVQGVDPDVELSAERVQGWLRDAVGVPVANDVRAVVRWTRRTVVAERFRDGRVFLAGDSAHQLSPSGAFGMNTGMGDVDNLGWKLEALLKGWGGPALPESYDLERRPVAVRNVTEAAKAFRGRGFATPSAFLDDTPEGARIRAEIGRRIDLETSASYRADGVRFDYCYAPSPIVVPDGTARAPYALTDYTPTSWPGARAPHATMADGRSTLDLFGRGFVLLHFGDEFPQREPLAEAARRRHVPLSIHEIADDDIAALYARNFVLVRPDGHVAWRSDLPPPDPAALIDRVRGAI